MTDTITLRRADAEQIRQALASGKKLYAALATLAAALAEPEPEPEQKPEPVAFTRKEWSPDCGEYVEFRTAEEMKFYDRADWTPLYAAPPAAALAEPDAKPDATHPGYIIGSHWLETAYSRIAAGEAEADVLAEVLGERGWAKREPATHGEISEKFYNAGSDRYYRQVDYRHGWRAAERFHGIAKEDGK
jgi:hypothetical protein